MDIKIKHFSKLTNNELHDLLSLRSAVFVVEQNCVYQDLDGNDKDAYLLLISEGSTVVATARILKRGVAYKEVSIGRVATSLKHRHLKLGHAILQNCMSFIKEELKEGAVRISAQSHLKNYYGKYGFELTGKEYLEDGIPHSEMLYKQNK